MRIYQVLLLALLLTACTGGGKSGKNAGNDNNETSHAIDIKKVQTIEFTVKGMTCEGCENAVQKSVQKLEGVASVNASYKDKKTSIRYDTSVVQISELETAIRDAGYKVAAYKTTN